MFEPSVRRTNLPTTESSGPKLSALSAIGFSGTFPLLIVTGRLSKS